MIDRIIQVFTKPRIQLTAIDEIIMTVVGVAVFFAVATPLVWAKICWDDRKKRS